MYNIKDSIMAQFDDYLKLREKRDKENFKKRMKWFQRDAPKDTKRLIEKINNKLYYLQNYGLSFCEPIEFADCREIKNPFVEQELKEKCDLTVEMVGEIAKIYPNAKKSKRQIEYSFVDYAIEGNKRIKEFKENITDIARELLGSVKKELENKISEFLVVDDRERIVIGNIAQFQLSNSKVYYEYLTSNQLNILVSEMNKYVKGANISWKKELSSLDIFVEKCAEKQVLEVLLDYHEITKENIDKINEVVNEITTKLVTVNKQEQMEQLNPKNLLIFPLEKKNNCVYNRYRMKDIFAKSPLFLQQLRKAVNDMLYDCRVVDIKILYDSESSRSMRGCGGGTHYYNERIEITVEEDKTKEPAINASLKFSDISCEDEINMLQDKYFEFIVTFVADKIKDGIDKFIIEKKFDPSSYSIDILIPYESSIVTLEEYQINIVDIASDYKDKILVAASKKFDVDLDVGIGFGSSYGSVNYHKRYIYAKVYPSKLCKQQSEI